MILLEAVRQAGIFISHEYYGVPQQGWAFIFRKAAVSVSNLLAMKVGDTPGRLVMRVYFERRFHSEEMLTGAVVRSDLSLDDMPVGEIRGSFSFLPRPMYEAMRSAGRAAKALPDMPYVPTARPLSPERVARVDSRNVVVAQATTDDSTAVYEVIVNNDHPSLSDHKLDHISGMLITEAFRQAAVCALLEVGELPDNVVAAPRAFDVVFTDFAEHELPLYCRMVDTQPEQVGSRVVVSLELVQGDTVIASARVGVGE